ncbi:unnamed protein product [Mortierella alpina]
MDHDQQSQDSLYSFHVPGSNNHNSNVNNGNGSNSGHPHPPPHPGSLTYPQANSPHPQQDWQHQQPPPTQGILSPSQSQQPFNTQHALHHPQHGSNNAYQGYHVDLQKAIPHHVDLYQPQDQELVNPLMSRPLNSHASNFTSPHQQQAQHQSYTPQHHSQYQHASPYHYQQQQQQHHHKQYPDQHSDPATPASTAASTLTPGSPASTPSQYHSEYPYIGTNAALPHAHKHASPTAHFHVSGTPVSGSQLTSPTTAQHLGAALPLGMPAWTQSHATAGSSGPPHLHPQQQQQQPYQHSARDRTSYYQPSQSQQSSHMYSQQDADQHHPQQQQHHAQVWVGSLPNPNSFQNGQDFLEQPDRQQQQQQQKQARPFGATEHDSSYAGGSNYMEGHAFAGNERSRMQPARHHTLARSLMDYSDNYSAQGQGPSLASQHPAMSSLEGLPLMPPSNLLQSDPHGQPFSPVPLMSPGAGTKGISTSLDSVPMGLGPPTIVAHPEYGTAMASYMQAPTTSASKASRASEGGAVQPSVSRHAPQRTLSAGVHPAPKHRTRTNSVNSSSSIASSGVMSSITSTLGATNISFSDAPSSSIHAVHSHSNMSTTVVGTSEGDYSNPSNDGSSSSATAKPRPGGHPRKAMAARVFECSFPGCTKAYTQLHNLKSHERTGHTPVQKPKPFLCIIAGCTKAFSQRKSLALHIRASHKEYKFKPFKCSQPGCQKSYTQLHNLRTHEKTVHMLDLSKKRVRNPITHTGEGSGMSPQDMDAAAGGGDHDGRLHGLGMRTTYAPKAGLGHESARDLADYEVGMEGEGEDEDEDEEEDEELPEDDDGEDEDYRDD